MIGIHVSGGSKPSTTRLRRACGGSQYWYDGGGTGRLSLTTKGYLYTSWGGERLYTNTRLSQSGVGYMPLEMNHIGTHHIMNTPYRDIVFHGLFWNLTPELCSNVWYRRARRYKTRCLHDQMRRPTGRSDIDLMYGQRMVSTAAHGGVLQLTKMRPHASS